MQTGRINLPQLSVLGVSASHEAGREAKMNP